MKSKIIDSEFLQLIKAKDLTPRIITSHELVTFKCHKCLAEGERDFSEAKRCFKKNGFAFQCSDCLKDKYRNRGDEWLANIRKAAQSEAHKKRAVLNSQKSVKKYFPEDIKKFLEKEGLSYEGDLSSPANSIKIIWPDGVFRNMRIRKFMLDGFIKRPKTGNESTNHLKFVNKINKLGLKIEIMPNNYATLTYKGRSWKQRWVNCVDVKCTRMMKNIDLGINMKKMLDSGVSLNRVCKHFGVDANRYYRNLRIGVGIQETSESTRNFSRLIDIEGAVYDKKLLDTDFRPDILVEKHKLIIETDGLYYHNEKFKEKNYHINRWSVFNKLGYSVLAFSEYEVKEKREIVDSMIANKMGNSKVIDLQKCTIKSVSTSDSADFFQKNHLKGKGSGETLGIYHDDVLVAALRYQRMNDETINISRFATLLGHTVRGGYSKLISMLPENLDIINFVDRRHGSGDSLLAHGFVKQKVHIGFEWTDNYYHWNRLKYPGNSGYDHGMVKFWDYGQVKYVKKAIK